MRTFKSGLAFRSLTTMVAGAMIWTLGFAHSASAQRAGTIDAGTNIAVRTNETINVKDDDGRVFTGVVDQDVKSRNGVVAIPRGSDVELVINRVSDNEVALDLNAVMVNGQRFGIDTETNVVSAERKDGLGANERTGKYVGGAAAIGAIIGAIAGGGKGAAIGAGVGAGAGAGTQILTRGGSVNVPAESLLTFRLAQPLRAGVAANSSMRNGVRYRNGYGNNGNNGNNGFNNNASTAVDSAAYREGLRAGRSDADRRLARNMQSSRWNRGPDRRDYEAGYTAGYEGLANNNNNNNNRSQTTTSTSSNGRGSVNIAANKSVSWQSAERNATVYVQVDNEAPKLFAAGQSGTLAAPWIADGHLYVFVLKDQNGNEIARAEQDLRAGRRRQSFR